MNTQADVLARADITPPDDALADIEVPVLTVPQRQGDVGIFPFEWDDPDTGEHFKLRGPLGRAEMDAMTVVPPQGVQVVIGEATGNTHILLPDAGDAVYWMTAASSAATVSLGVLHVPAGATAWLCHSDEHGVNGIGPGTYVLNGKREMAEEIRRVAD